MLKDVQLFIQLLFFVAFAITNAFTLPDTCTVAKASYKSSGCCGKEKKTETFHVSYPEDDFNSDSVADLKSELKEIYSLKKPKNVILVVADGMGLELSYASRLRQGELHGPNGKSIESYETTLDNMPHVMITRTHTVDHQTPDSAGTGTALHAGVKTISGVINTKPTLKRGACPALDGSDNITPLVDKLIGKKTVGIVSTARLTHATPASAYAVTSNRDYENDKDTSEICNGKLKSIATQLTDALNERKIILALGGGYKEIDASDYSKFTYLSNRSQMMEYDFSQKTDRPVIGIFAHKKDRKDASGHMAYENDRSDSEPSLKEMMEAAMTFMSANDDDHGYFLTVEAGRVDHGLHGGNLHKALDDIIIFENAVQAALDKANGDTLVIVTADHSHTLAFNGYCGAGSSVLGYCQSGSAPNAWNYMPKLGHVVLDHYRIPMTVAAFVNGPGARAFADMRQGMPTLRAAPPGAYDAYGYPNAIGASTTLHNMSCVVNVSAIIGNQIPIDQLGSCLTEDQAKGAHTQQPALFPTTMESHGGIDIITRCAGPMSHLCSGTKDMTFIGVLIHYTLGLDA